ncbi:flagellar assembly protein FliH [Paenacidovorax monticola]|uniref:Flagellar assembly protein FliH n=1 Tax=Paenacidovorax monticola TaxID=1926868 RepID=A0A7H0HEI1_9BURK|nr:flagellar assembly protein FliH [Paenacidovorax monticola]QNP58947.1 flagellar assembly protein FliH [Paenacidovorax monticola]
MVTGGGSRHYTRFIPSEEIGADAVTQWRFGAVDGSDLLPLPVPQDVVEVAAPMVDEAEHQSLLQQAREQARAEGHAEGLAQGRAEATLEWQQRMDDYAAGPGQEAARRMETLVQSLEGSLGELQQRMAQDVLQLACDIARQVVRHEISANPQALLPVVREAMGMLVAEGRPATVRLHPEDLKALEQPLSEEFAQAKLQWLADASLSPGDCQVESGGTVVDGGLDKRWRRAIAALGLVSAWQEAADGP